MTLILYLAALWFAAIGLTSLMLIIREMRQDGDWRRAVSDDLALWHYLCTALAAALAGLAHWW